MGTFILSRKVLFGCTGRTLVPLDTKLFALCILRLNVLLKHFMRKVQQHFMRKVKQDQFQPSGRKTAIISERVRRMVGEYSFAVCDNITFAVIYTFPHIPKRYFALLSCAYTCISPNRFRLNCIIYAPLHELLSASPQSRLRDTQKLFLFNFTGYVLRGKQKIGKDYRVFHVL